MIVYRNFIAYRDRPSAYCVEFKWVKTFGLFPPFKKSSNGLAKSMPF